MRLTRRSVAAVAAIVTLGIGVGSAAAEELWILGETFKVVMSALTFHAEGVSEASCPITLEGSFTASTFVETPRTRIGSVTRGRLGTCTGGSASILTETLPWSLQYDSYEGSGPEFTSMNTRVVGAGFSATLSGLTCLAGSEESQPMKARFLHEAAGEIHEVRADESARIRLRGTFCIGNGWLSGTGRNTLVRSTEEAVAVLNGTPTALRRTDGRPLDTPVLAAVGDTATVTVINGWRGELLEIIALPISLDTTKFRIENTGTTCWNSIRTLQAAGNNSCNIRIRRIGGAMNDVVEIWIEYRTSLTFPFQPIPQAFRVRAG
ncbi:MAG TPA: hypothetical protein VF250_14280 [Conexibacter sp.]